eukprot:g78933.t1
MPADEQHFDKAIDPNFRMKIREERIFHMRPYVCAQRLRDYCQRKLDKDEVLHIPGIRCQHRACHANQAFLLTEASSLGFDIRSEAEQENSFHQINHSDDGDEDDSDALVKKRADQQKRRSERKKLRASSSSRAQRRRIASRSNSSSSPNSDDNSVPLMVSPLASECTASSPTVSLKPTVSWSHFADWKEHFRHLARMANLDLRVRERISQQCSYCGSPRSPYLLRTRVPQFQYNWQVFRKA